MPTSFWLETKEDAVVAQGHSACSKKILIKLRYELSHLIANAFFAVKKTC